MATMTNLEIIQKLTGCTDSTLLSALMQDAEESILVMTGRTHMIDALNGALRELVICNYNRLGSEGMSSRNDSEVGISSSFEDIPQTLRQKIMRYSLVRVGGVYHETHETSPQA